MARKAFYFDSSRCVACKTCQVACKKKNDLPIGINYRAVASYEVGEFPTAKMYHISHTCKHCLNRCALRQFEQRLSADCRRAARLGAAMCYHSRSLKYIACRRVGPSTHVMRIVRPLKMLAPWALFVCRGLARPLGSPRKPGHRCGRPGSRAAVRPSAARQHEEKGSEA